MTSTIDFAKLELKPDHKYILFVDPRTVDLDVLAKDVDLPPDVIIIPALPRDGKSLKDSVVLVDRGGNAEEWIEAMTKEDHDGVPE